MDILDKLADNIKTTELLSEFITDSSSELYDFLFIQKYADLFASKDRIDFIIQNNIQKIKRLDLKNNESVLFINMLLDISERLGLLLSFQTLYNFLVRNNCSIGNRLNASALYLIGVRNINDYSLRLYDILNHLEIAHQEEEDNEDNVVAIVIKFYAQLVNNFGKYNLVGVNKIRDILKSKVDEFLFLKNKNIDIVLSVDTTNFVLAYQNIQLVLDSFLTKSKLYPSYNESQLLIEKNTAYASILSTSDNNYSEIQNISAKKYKLIADDQIFYSLQRGVKILEEEKQLFAYMFSFGKMHYKKLTSAFDYLPKNFFEDKTNLIDWGCGQGMASMTYCDYILKKEITQTIEMVTLIEPSEIAIKRGALHVEKYLPATNILTINKDLDSLNLKDISKISKKNNLHLFSNILDIDFFSLTDLTKLIENKFQGENYFVCVSPYVTALKTNRLDSFCDYFSQKENFTMIKSIDNTKGEWINGWSRVIRVFKVQI